jgi:tRNA/tmRNA/rRNA uracil-C5-methylase (TrmA/RlmC/RlmD family)
METGDEVIVEVTAIAHGGHCIARHEGRVLFVRHAIPGERIRARIIEITKTFARADCIEVLEPSPNRIKPLCRYAGPGGCGGCDFQHVKQEHQRLLKSQIIKEQFARLAKMDVDVKVEEVIPFLGWRTRMEFNVSSNRKIALFRSRSNELIEIERCEIADPTIEIAQLNAVKLPAGKKVDVAVGSDNKVTVAIEGRQDFELVRQRVGGFEFTLAPESFWQSHRAAPELLSKVVSEFTSASTSDHIFDLYSGVGLFAAALLDRVGPTGRITMIEESTSAVTDARRNFASATNVEIIEGRVERMLGKFARADVVVLDPPRSGAGFKVIESIVKLAPRNITYVACDPAALARDSAYLKERGYEMEQIRAFDLFPMTQHMECVASFIRA